MNKADVTQAISHIFDLCHSKAQSCISGKELANHADICVRMADHYEAEATTFGRGVPKALRVELMTSIQTLRDKAIEFASPEAQQSRDNYRQQLQQTARDKQSATRH